MLTGMFDGTHHGHTLHRLTVMGDGTQGGVLLLLTGMEDVLTVC